MVKIVKGNHTLTVTRGAFHNYYKPLGYEPVEAPRSLEADPGMFTGEEGHSPDHEPAAASEGYTQEQVMGMTLDQLYEAADKLGINYQRVRTKGDLVKLILQAL
jgi:hypothetical protein